MENTHIIFCDGACSGNPGPGGWGALIWSLHSHTVCELGGKKNPTTNNQMELTACIESLKLLAKTPNPTILYTDSTYVIRGITQWVYGWAKKNWKTSDGKEVQNKKLWQSLLGVIEGYQEKITWKYVPGHSGIPANERVDTIAVAFSKSQDLHLFQGAEEDYEIDLKGSLQNFPLPENKFSAGEKKQAVCYLSLLGGIVERHESWAACERRVKGQSGAKFKKAMSEEEAEKILKGWGVR